MQEEIDKIGLLLTSDEKNSFLALELLKGASQAVQDAVQLHFNLLLEASKSNSLNILPFVLKNIETGHCSFEQQKVLWEMPLLAKKITVIKLARYHHRMNNIYSLPDSIGNLKNLQELHLFANSLKELPRSFGNLNQLTYLYLSRNLFKKFPPSILQLSQLTDLFLSGNQLEELPDDLKNLNHLKYLDLSYNHLKILPDTIYQLEQLNDLIINNNPITMLPENIGQLKKLKTLNFSSCNLQYIPATIGELDQLKELDFSHNNDLKEVPDSLFKLKNLKKLALPESITPFINLKELQELFPSTKIKMA